MASGTASGPDLIGSSLAPAAVPGASPTAERVECPAPTDDEPTDDEPTVDSVGLRYAPARSTGDGASVDTGAGRDRDGVPASSGESGRSSTLGAHGLTGACGGGGGGGPSGAAVVGDGIGSGPVQSGRHGASWSASFMRAW
ncbi:MAG: hypothetical protein AAGG08_07420 [Actinomycetota bacterium]